MDDSQLIKACKNLDRRAQQELYERYAPKMMGVCLRYCKDEDTAHDILHDGFVRVFTHIGSFKGKGSFDGWLRRIFVNLALENYRLEKKKNEITTDVELLEANITAEMEKDYYIGDITQEELFNLIKTLPKGYKTIFNLFVFEDLSHKEIAKILGINEAASRSQYSRARAFLKKRLNAILEKSKI